MQLQEFRDLLKGSDTLEVVLISPDGTPYEVHGVEEGDGPEGRRELWVVAGDLLPT